MVATVHVDLSDHAGGDSIPHLGAGHVELDEGQISELIEDLNRAAS